ncbi:MAG TPA: hypothetical protein VF735_19995 [Pyrinomonadaceae bacterium]|jgi:hypothetical protein
MKRGSTSVKLILFLTLVLFALCVVLVGAVVITRRTTTLSANNRAGSSNGYDIKAESEAAASLLEAAGVSLPSAEGSWLIISYAGGGPAGKISGGVVITSEGVVAAGGPSKLDEFRLSCKERLSADDLRQFEQKILSAHPLSWSERYTAPGSPDGCCDQYSYMLELQRRQPDGTKQLHTTSWYDSSAFLRPADLSSMHEAMSMIKNNALKRCVD